MKMKKLLSIGALTLTLMTCTSVSAFAADTVGNRKDAAIKMTNKALEGKEVVNNVDVTIKTPVKDYATLDLVNTVTNAAGITKDEDKKLVEGYYNDGNTLKGILLLLYKYNNSNPDMTNDDTWSKCMDALDNLGCKLETKNDTELKKEIESYFKLNGDFTVGKNSDNETVISLKNGNSILLQISSEDIWEFEDILFNNNIDSWTKLKEYLKTVKNTDGKGIDYTGFLNSQSE